MWYGQKTHERLEAQKQIGTYLIILQDGSQVEQWGYNKEDAKKRAIRNKRIMENRAEFYEMIKLKRLPFKINKRF